MRTRVTGLAALALSILAFPAIGNPWSAPSHDGASRASLVSQVSETRIHRRSVAKHIRFKRADRVPSVPASFAAKPRTDAILKEDCQWTNDNVASCLVWDCDKEGVCVELGKYCIDGMARDVPCP